MSLGEALGAPHREAREEGRIHVDASAWPRVALVWPGGVRSDSEVAAGLRSLERLAQRGRAHGLLVDARDARAPTPSQLGMILDLARRTGPGARCVAHAVVTRSPGVRAIVDSLRWMHLTPARWAHFDDLSAATEWLDGEIASASRRRVRGAERAQPRC